MGQALGRRAKGIFNATVGWLAVAMLRALRLTNRKRMADRLGWMLRKIGPWLPEHQIGRANLIAAFPEKSAADIENILSGVWDNLGRVAAEFAHLDRFEIPNPRQLHSKDVSYDPVSFERFVRLNDSGKPSLFFAAHLANWELPALAPPLFDVKANVLYRRPNIGAISDAVVAMRAGCMATLVPTGLEAPVRLARALENGEHVGMLVDQHYVKGVDVVFFGRRCKANPLLAQLARHLECPIRGIRMVRQPDGHTFWGEFTDSIEPKRDAEGRIDVRGTMQVITSVIEGWIREHPEQWLWLHRRWRDH